ncbi:uncharacterized protein LOC117781472 [Drosophila innubila]|uniref:uncharacterized protein LOC117781472 n=1 Tax=Drosophila innubila TaxID=198719 RepID=UPI00148DC713|nr:uncharacterized protein LOC117781472 [Drosophila innubila]
MRRQQGEQQTQKSLPTPYDVMRLQNCKSFKFRRGEMYPSIRPPISQCNPAQTIDLLSDTMEANGCGPIDATLLDQTKESPYADSMSNGGKINSHVEFPCRDKKRKLHEQVMGDPEMSEKWSKLTPYELIRMHNCKTYIYQNSETYPNIRPPINRCSVAKTAEALVDALEDNCCGRPFDMEQDDIMEVWKQSPHKNTLSFYGIGTGIPQPEAIVFNNVISQCLDKVNSPKPMKEEIPKPQKPKLPKKSQICKGLVLNCPLLAAKISKMPTVQRKLNAREALKYVHCPRSAKNSDMPFIDDAPKVNAQKLVPKTKTSPKNKKYFYCDLRCGIPENKCTELEWMKYKADPGTYEKAFNKELQEMEEKTQPEPRNYDELFEELITCFEVDKNVDPLCEVYKKCCTKSTQDDDEEEGGAGHGGAGGGGGAGGKKKPKPGEDESSLIDKDKKGDKNKSDKDKDKDTDKDKDKERDTDKDKDKNKDKDKDKDSNKDINKDKDKNKNKDKDANKNKDKLDKDDDESFKSGAHTPGKEKPGKDKNKTGTDNDKTGKDDDKPVKDKFGNVVDDPSAVDLTGKDKGKDKNKGKDKDKDKTKQSESDNNISNDKKNQWPGSFDSGEDKNKSSNKDNDNIPTAEGLPLDELSAEEPKSDTDKSGSQYKKKPKPPKKPGHKGDSSYNKNKGDRPLTFHKPHLPKPPVLDINKTDKTAVEIPKDCPCEICEFMTRRGQECDTPLIREMKQKEKRRKLLEYYRKMCHHQNAKCAAPEYRAPLHKCDPIVCDNTFCTNPKLAEYSDCMNAMYELQKLLGPKHRIVDNELRFNLEDLKRRLGRRFCKCLQ